MRKFFTFPSNEEILSIQKGESSYYWTKCFENFLRKHGLVYLSSDLRSCFRFIGRKAECDYQQFPFSIIECPQKQQGLDFLSYDHESECVHLYDQQKNYIGTCGYPKIRLRRIPPSGEKYKDPYLYIDKNKFHNHKAIRWQSFDANDSDHIYAYIKKENDDVFYPCIVEKEQKLLLGLPLFDLVGVAASFPPLEEGYYDTLISAVNYVIENFFFQIILVYLRKHNLSHVIARVWPNGFQSCFTLRHDYDRPISLLKQAFIMLIYKITSIKTSFSLLHYNIQAGHFWLLKKFGHEINLHCTTSHPQAFEEELHDVQRKVGVSFLGMTCHGGQGARGWLGDVHYDVLENNRLLYGEILGRQSGLPQKVNRIKNNLPEIAELYVPASHISIDAGMKKDAHYLEDLLVSVPQSLALGEHVVLMSHPDIHMKEVFKLIFKVIKKNHWKATFKDVLLWTKNTRYNVSFEEKGDQINISVPINTPHTPVYFYFQKEKYTDIKLIFKSGAFMGKFSERKLNQ